MWLSCAFTELRRCSLYKCKLQLACVSERLVWLLTHISCISNGISLHAENKCLQWFLAEPHRRLPVPLPWFNIPKKLVTLAPGNISCYRIRSHAARALVVFSQLPRTSSQCFGVVLHCSPWRAILERKGRIDTKHWCRCTSFGHDFQHKSLWSW